MTGLVIEEEEDRGMLDDVGNLDNDRESFYGDDKPTKDVTLPKENTKPKSGLKSPTNLKKSDGAKVPKKSTFGKAAEEKKNKLGDAKTPKTPKAPGLKRDASSKHGLPSKTPAIASANLLGADLKKPAKKKKKGIKKKKKSVKEDQVISINRLDS